jgi:hypothetical protein
VVARTIEKEEIDEIAWLRAREKTRQLRCAQIHERLEHDALEGLARLERWRRLVHRVELERATRRGHVCTNERPGVSHEDDRSAGSVGDLGEVAHESAYVLGPTAHQLDVARETVPEVGTAERRTAPERAWDPLLTCAKHLEDLA